MSAQFNEMREYAAWLNSKFPNITESQLMMISAQMVQNRILEEALMTGKDNPGSIEMIAIALGGNMDDQFNIAESINNISDYLEETKIALESINTVLKGSTISNE
ncbi:MAG: hypothetical protein ACOYN4_05300 [Bacteroidales bacterium]